MRSGFRNAAAGLGITAAVGAVVVPVTSAASARATTSGTIQILVAGNNNRAPNDVVTGAIIDHGTDRTGHNQNYEKVILSKGSFEIDSEAFDKTYRAKTDTKGCTQSFTLSGVNMPLSRGTGAYAGIIGSVSLSGFGIDVYKLKNGKCDFSADGTYGNFIIRGSGHVSY